MQLLSPSAVPLLVIIPSGRPGNQFPNYLLPSILYLISHSFTPALLSKGKLCLFTPLVSSLFILFLFTLPHLLHMLLPSPFISSPPPFIVAFHSSPSPSLNLSCSLSSSFFLLCSACFCHYFFLLSQHYFLPLVNFLPFSPAVPPLTFRTAFICTTPQFAQPPCNKTMCLLPSTSENKMIVKLFHVIKPDI